MNEEPQISTEPTTKRRRTRKEMAIKKPTQPVDRADRWTDGLQRPTYGSDGNDYSYRDNRTADHMGIVGGRRAWMRCKTEITAETGENIAETHNREAWPGDVTKSTAK